MARAVEILGESTRPMPELAKAQMPAIPWTKMMGIRNILAHEYGELDLQTLFETVANDIPTLVQELDRVIGRVECLHNASLDIPLWEPEE